MEDHEEEISRPEQIAVPVVFAVIFAIGIVGNGVLIFIVVRNKAMRTKPNILIVNMAVGDFLLILISVPVTSTFYALDQWDLGTPMCKINEFLQTLSLGVSIFTLTALSVDRFVAIVYPLTSYSSQSLTRIVAASVLIWAMSTGLALMDLVGANVVGCLHCEQPFLVCSVFPQEWGPTYKNFRVIFRFIVFFAAPMTIIIALYAAIAVVLLRQSETLTNTMAVTAAATNAASGSDLKMGSENAAVLRQIQSRKKIAKVVLSFVVVFIVCWLPRHVYLMCYHYLHDFHYDLFWHVFKLLGFCLMFIYSSINPLALYLLNEEFRRYYHHYLFGCCYRPWRLQYSKRRSTQIESRILQTIITNASLEDLIDAGQNGSPEIMKLTTGALK